MWNVLFIIAISLQAFLLSLMVFLAVVDKHRMFKIEQLWYALPPAIKIVEDKK